jgi:hypothetical protein
MSFTNFLLLVLVILVGVPSSHFDVGVLRNEMTLLATPKAWPLGSPLDLDLFLANTVGQKPPSNRK